MTATYPAASGSARAETSDDIPSRRPDSEAIGRSVASIVANVERVVKGKSEAVRMAVVCLLADGHLLVEDVPGVGKTSLAKALAASIRCSWRRVQFTPDLLPADLVGVSVWKRSSDSFEFQPGPLFANIVLTDEINRASPKTQSALLESMEERQITADGTTYTLPHPFMVIATQNPIEQEGTYRLPESQLDRFLLRISLGYPSRDAELDILDNPSAHETLESLDAVITAAEVVALVDAVKHVHLADPLRHYLVDISEASRRHSALLLGLSPRATVQLARAVRAMAAAVGRDYATPDDVKTVGVSVLAHRLVLRPEVVGRGASAEDVVEELLATVPVPTRR